MAAVLVDGEKLMTQKHYRWGMMIVLCLAALLRLYALGQVPHGMTWDEAAIGYNGFAVLTTRRDEWLTRLPVTFWSFGDYKAPLGIYLNGLFTYAFGMNLWAVRLPFALAGLAAILGIIYLTRIVVEMSGEKPEQAHGLALLAGVVMAITPWHLHFSRIGFESGLALTLYIWAIYFFHKALTVAKVWRRYVDFTLSILGFVASVYAYHSAKITTPLIVLFLVIRHRKIILARWKNLAVASAIGLVALYPLVKDALFGKGLARAGTLIFLQGLSFVELVKTFFGQLWQHLSPSFLLLGETTTLRHGDGRWGVLLPMTFVLVVLALVFAFKKKTAWLYLFWLGLAMAMIGLLPAALGTEVPHSNRALSALPGFIILALAGWQGIVSSKMAEGIKRTLVGMAILFESLFFMSYLHDYYTRFAQESAPAFQDGYLEAFQFALPYERGEAGLKAVDKIIFTSDYGQPYIYALFVRQTNPIWYQGGSLIKYEFKDEVTIGDLERPNTLVVASNTDELLSANDQADQIINGSDGLPRFRIYYQP